MTSKLHCPSCKSNSITITDSELVCHGCGNREYLYDYANAYDNPMPLPQPDTNEIEDRVANLEAISAQPGRIPRRYYDEFQQIRGEMAHLHQKIAERSTKQKATIKSGYKGLEVE